MNRKELKQIQHLGLTTKEAAEKMYSLFQAVKKATRSISELPVCVKAAKKKHGLTDR